MRITLTELIEECMSGWKYNEYSFNEDRSVLHICMKGFGDSIEYYQFGCWQECDFVTQGFYPIEDGEEVDDKDDGVTPMRSHDYKGVYQQWWLQLPPNRKRGDTYTLEELRGMIKSSDGWGDDVVGGGYSYYNCDEDYTG